MSLWCGKSGGGSGPATRQFSVWMRVMILVSSLPDAPRGEQMPPCWHTAGDPEINIRVFSPRQLPGPFCKADKRAHSNASPGVTVRSSPGVWGGNRLFLLIFTHLYLLLCFFMSLFTPCKGLIRQVMPLQ